VAYFLYGKWMQKHGVGGFGYADEYEAAVKAKA
jgi:hypothetical protein